MHKWVLIVVKSYCDCTQSSLQEQVTVLNIKIWLASQMKRHILDLRITNYDIPSSSTSHIQLLFGSTRWANKTVHVANELFELLLRTEECLVIEVYYSQMFCDCTIMLISMGYHWMSISI